MTEPVLEVVEFRASGHSEAVLAAAAGMHEWLSRQPGFRWRRLAKLSDGQFIDCIEWQNREAAQAAAAKIMSAPEAGAFMALIDGPSVIMKHASVMVAQ